MQQGTSPAYRLKMSDVKRLWLYVSRRGDDECWPWLGSMDGSRGLFSWGPAANRKMASVARVIFALNVGPIPAGMSVCHRTKGPACCNPRHLTLKTRSQNMRDRAAWKRAERTTNQKKTKTELRREADTHRLWSHVDRINDDNEETCWPWRGPEYRGGYGSLLFMGRRETAPRAIYEAEHGPIPGGMSVCHRCDNPPCCRPSHLFLGTPKDNSEDMLAKGRARGQQYSGEMFADACADCGELTDLCQCPRLASLTTP